MKIEIFDVEHGQCAMITCPNGKKLMVDAGHATGKWWPSTHFVGQAIEQLIITNYDEDHTSDVVDLLENCRVNSILRNPSIRAVDLRSMKAATGGMGKGVQRLYDWLVTVESTPGGIPARVDLGDVWVNPYWAIYPHFTDANNLSLVSFINYGVFSILFPGDLEVEGWKLMLQNAEFRDAVRNVNVLVASHHGRENGCCEELYTLTGWKPQVTIISDAGKEYATQDTVGWYANRTLGCNVVGGGTRKVFTTRSDGKITINVQRDGQWTIGPTGSTRIEPTLGDLIARRSTLLNLT